MITTTAYNQMLELMYQKKLENSDALISLIISPKHTISKFEEDGKMIVLENKQFNK